MAKHKVDISGLNTSNIPVLTNEEMTNLFIEYQNGNIDAKEKLVSGNLKLVLSILKSFTGRTDNMDDLFQVGCIGLIKAIDNFDLSHDVKFSTYAVPMILGEVKRFLRDNNSIRVARSTKDIAYKALKVKEELTNRLGSEPTIKQISDELKLEETEVQNAINSMKEVVSMFEPIYNDGGDTIYLVDQLEDKKDSTYPIEYKIALKEALKELKQKEKYIIYERYIMGKTQLELADEIGISQAQISRLEKSGMEHIKRKIK